MSGGKWIVAALGAGLVGLAGPASAANAGFAGFWQPVSKVETLRTATGAAPPLKAAARKTYEANQAAAARGDRKFDDEHNCLPIGLTRLMAESPFELVQTDKQVDFVFEWNRYVLQAPVRQQHPKQYAYPYYVGHAIARYEGDALIVDSVYFNDETILDRSGLPHSDALHVRQQLQLEGQDTLVDTLTIEDPRTFTQSWQTVLKYQRLPADTVLKEDVCVERLGLKKLDASK
ncbi:MAG: hypothetical protein QM718_03060 [Steroidobacteraceae bacterium]